MLGFVLSTAVFSFSLSFDLYFPSGSFEIGGKRFISLHVRLCPPAAGTTGRVVEGDESLPGDPCTEGTSQMGSAPCPPPPASSVDVGPERSPPPAKAAAAGCLWCCSESIVFLSPSTCSAQARLARLRPGQRGSFLLLGCRGLSLLRTLTLGRLFSSFRWPASLHGSVPGVDACSYPLNVFALQFVQPDFPYCFHRKRTSWVFSLSA